MQKLVDPHPFREPTLPFAARARGATLCLLAAAVLSAHGAAGCGNDGTGGPDAQMTPDSIAPADAGDDLSAPDTADAGPGPDGAGDAVMTPDAPGPEICKPQDEVPCTDQSFAQLGLFETVNPAAVTEEGPGGGEFLTHIDATAGGMTPTQAFVYVRFTDEGLAKVDISDEEAFSSQEWDLAVRRFILRVNSGVSGPSCVTAARTAPGTTFEGLTEVPEGLSYRTESYFTTESCEYVPDGSGLGSPGTALASFWTYPGCVQMTGNVYVIERADGRHVKLQVVSYYTPEVQEVCDTTDALPPGMPSGAGNVRIRWAFLD